jgi:hypothetical protein
MIKYFDRSLASYVGVGAIFMGIVFCLVMIGNAPVSAQTPGVCRAAIVLDRSESVDPDDLETMRQQVTRLFQPGGVNNPNVQLAFWSFSSTSNSSANYNAPYNGFVSSQGVNSAFQTNLYQLAPGGHTNYEQGFGYNGYITGNQTMNTSGGINNIINQASVIVFMTDGVPDLPVPAGQLPRDNYVTARDAARSAVLKHKAAGKTIVGGIVGNISQNSLNYVLNGSDGDGTDTFRVTSDYSDVTAQLSTVIRNRCNAAPVEEYDLVPSAFTPNNVISGTDGAAITYNVNNSATTGVTNPTNWTVQQMLVDRDQSVDPLYFNNQPYRDSYDCNQLRNLINQHSSPCTQIASGQTIFGPGNTSLDDQVPLSATNVELRDEWPIGSKVCFILTIDRPTMNATPVDRFSKAACITIGKRPMVQVHGGDLKVGRYFITDSIPTGSDPDDQARVVGSLSRKQDGQTYGGWVEYGIYAPGRVSGIASSSGLAGGMNTTMASAQGMWSKLTFANTDNEFGSFTPSSIGMGTIPNAKSAILAGRNVTNNLNGIPSIALNGPSSRGLYQKDSGNLTINASVIQGGNTVIVYVPTGTVTIAGNIDYSDGPYTNINQIPQLVIIAKSIIINASVTHVSGWMIADDATDGRITTCDHAGNLTIFDCLQELRIDGPIMAQHLSLRRTANAGSIASGSASLPAETINLPADAYLWAQSAGGNDGRALTTFTTELPPYF